MIKKYAFLPFIILSLSVSMQICAQEGVINNSSTSKDNGEGLDSTQKSSDLDWQTTISPFVEFLGKGFFSVNVDYRWSKSHAISFGLQPLEVVAPDIMYYYFCGRRQRCEIGGGLTVGFSNELKPSAILFHGVIGYRNQKKKGLFFRAGVTPLYVIMFNNPERSNKFYPFLGLSLGYCF